jgi:hypothetical protein
MITVRAGKNRKYREIPVHTSLHEHLKLRARRPAPGPSPARRGGRVRVPHGRARRGRAQIVRVKATPEAVKPCR